MKEVQRVYLINDKNTEMRGTTKFLNVMGFNGQGFVHSVITLFSRMVHLNVRETIATIARDTHTGGQDHVSFHFPP